MYEEKKMTSNLKKNFLVKNLEHLVKCINGYKINQSNDFDETQKALSKLKNKKLWKKTSRSKTIKLWRKTAFSKRTVILKQLKEYLNMIDLLFE